MNPTPRAEPEGAAGEHPPPGQLEAVAFGWLTGDSAAAIRAHAAGCPRCGPLLAADDEVRQRLALLRADEPRVDVVQQVLRRLATDRTAETTGAADVRRRSVRSVRSRWPVLHLGSLRPVVLRGAAVAACLALVIALASAAAAPGPLQAAAHRLRTLVFREVPPPGQPGAPATRLQTPGPTGPGGGPIQRMPLEEARRAVSFPVELPQALPAGFTLAEVAVFQLPPSAPPSQVHLTYRRPGAHQPLVLTYQAPGTAREVLVAPGAARELVVDGYPAVYLDLAVEGLRAAPGADASAGPGRAEPPQLGRLLVERPAVVLIAVGDRRDGLDAAALATIVASIP